MTQLELVEAWNDAITRMNSHAARGDSVATDTAWNEANALADRLGELTEDWV